MEKINCFGDICPIPLIRLKDSLKKLKTNDSIMLVVDHSCVVEAIGEYYASTEHSIEIEEVLNGVWEIIVTKR